MAQVLARLQRLLADVNSGLDDIAALIRLDSALTTRVIQASNSAVFGRGGTCRTIEEAVNRVGFRQVYHVVSVAAAKSVVAQDLPAYGRDSLAMWRESVACAFAAELLAERMGEETAVAYMTGLLHGIGRIAINKCIGAISGDPQRVLTDEGFPADHSGAEIALLGFTQADVGACMLSKWGFPAENSVPIRYQYDPLGADVPHDRMAAILYCARFLESTLLKGEAPGETAGAEDVLQTLRLSREELLECLPPVEAQVNRATQLMTP